MLLIISDDDNNFLKIEQGNIYYNVEVSNIVGGVPPSTYEPKESIEILNSLLQVQKP